jgi:hypothetical protein
MSKKKVIPTKKSAYINARLSQLRLVSERASTAQILPSTQPMQLQTEVTSGFSIGINSPNEPTLIVMRIDYKAILKILGTDNKILEYEATHEAMFAIERWAGFDDWTNMPTDGITPYMTIINNIALRKAEGTILEMGFKGIALPQPERFDGILTSVNMVSADATKTGK